ncbi:lipid-A-disaccharide synthase [Hydrogenivirga sp.]
MSAKIFLSIGDLSAANYAYEIFREGFQDFELIGITDDRLESLGVRSVARISSLSVVGIAEALPRLLEIRRIYRKALQALSDCDVLIACDAPGFNLRLIREARRLGVKKIIYFISPQVWAWKPKRAEAIARFADHLVVILPFEVDIYRRFEGSGFRVHYVGHPLVDMVKPSLSREEFLGFLDVKGGLINLMPGSRWGEIKRHLPLVRKAAEHFLASGYGVVLPTFGEFKGFLNTHLGDLPIRIITEEEVGSPAYNSMFYSEFSLIASGTSSLEAALALNPHLVYYKVNPLTLFIARFLVKLRHVSLPNIILGREVVPELINRSPEEVIRVAASLLEEEERLEDMRDSFAELRGLLGGEGVLPRLRELFRELTA